MWQYSALSLCLFLAVIALVISQSSIFQQKCDQDTLAKDCVADANPISKKSDHEYDENCASNLDYMFNSKEEPAMRMLNSFGKPTKDLLSGRAVWPGNYDQCRGVAVPERHGMKGRFCWIIAALPDNKKTPYVRIGVCVPDTCNAEDIRRNYHIFQPRGKNIFMKNVSLYRVSCPEVDKSWTASAVICICVCVLLAVIIIIATCNDLYGQEKNSTHDYMVQEKRVDKLGWRGEILNCFSAAKNSSMILDTKFRKDDVESIYGIRLMATNLVVLHHICMASAYLAANFADFVQEASASTFFIFLVNDIWGDKFFFSSGFMVMYTYRKGNEKSILKWILFYIHRLVRLMPALALRLYVYINLFMYMSDGPFWSMTRGMVRQCEEHWWKNILFINNLQSLSEMCMEESWFLSIDMQLYLITPLFLVTLHWWPMVGFIISGLSIFGSFVITAAHFYYKRSSLIIKEIVLIPLSDEFKRPDIPYFDIMYQPISRLAAYLVGIVFAYLFLKFKNQKVVLSKVYLFCCHRPDDSLHPETEMFEIFPNI